MAGATVLDAPVAAPPLADGPVEIREARPEEVEPARALQRATFDLPPGGDLAHPGHRQDLKVVVRGGKVVSCLTLIHATAYVRGAVLPVGGIRHVATDPEERNRGYASSLIRETLQAMRRSGLSGSLLFPFSFRYYRKFGYELGGNHCLFWCRPNCIAAYSERRAVRPAAEEDEGALARFTEEVGRDRALFLARDCHRWGRIRNDYRTVVHGNGRIEGYAVTAETRDSYGGKVLRVVDLAARTPAAWRGLLGSLAEFNGESVEWLASATDLAASHLMRSPAPLREGFKPRGIATVRPMFQFRVTDVEGALRAAAAVFPAGTYRLALRIRDDVLPENSRPVAVQASGDRIEVRAARPSDPYLEMDIQAFSQVFCGYMAPGEAASQELCRTSSPAALETAELLFPAGEPFISEVDRF